MLLESLNIPLCLQEQRKVLASKFIRTGSRCLWDLGLLSLQLPHNSIKGHLFVYVSKRMHMGQKSHFEISTFSKSTILQDISDTKKQSLQKDISLLSYFKFSKSCQTLLEEYISEKRGYKLPYSFQ